MKGTSLLFGQLLFLTGCSTMPETVRVNVPVAVLCTEATPDRPAMPTDALKPGVDLFTFTTAAQAEIALREGYEAKLLAALQNCKGKP